MTPNTQTLQVLWNPRSGQQLRKGDLMRHLQRSLPHWRLKVDNITSPKAVEKACLRAKAEKYQGILLLGGDGTINHVLPYLIHGHLPLLVMPMGTANDFATHHQMPFDFAAVKERLNQNKITYVDVLTVNQRPLATVGGLGVAASVLKRFEGLRQHQLFQSLAKPFKSDVYSMMAALTIGVGKDWQFAAKIKWKDQNGMQEKVIESGCILVGNQSRVGKSLYMSETSSQQDGLFEVTVVTSKSRFSQARAMYDFKRKHFADDNLLQIKTTDLCIEVLGNQPHPFFGDGEIWSLSHVYQCQILPRALPIFGGGEGSHEPWQKRENA